jgi:3-methyladenine DNA glycosylase AlkD
MSHPLVTALEALADRRHASGLARFFKTGPGQYGEGDVFLGLTVPQVRTVVAEYEGALTEAEIETLLQSPFHEVRLAAVLALVAQFEAATDSRRAELAAFYLAHLEHVNNWDLVDCSAPKILGAYLLEEDAPGRLEKLARSRHLWTQRVAMVATAAFIHDGQLEPTLKIATILLHHPHDLMHKAVGWMLREVGKKNERTLKTFLTKYAPPMPRTALRYAIEKFPQSERTRFLKMRLTKKGQRELPNGDA